MVEPGRGDERQHSRRAGQGVLERARIHEPERQVDRRAGYAVIVVADLARVQDHPQPDLFLGPVRIVVCAQRLSERLWQHFRKARFGHLRGSQEEHAITAIFGLTALPGDSRRPESLLQCLVQASTDRKLVRIGPAPISEPLDVHHENGPVYWHPPTLHLTSDSRNGPGAMLC